MPRSTPSFAPAFTLGLLSATLGAQALTVPTSRVPHTHELPHSVHYPLMVPQCRLQILFDRAELNGAATLSASRVSLRYDGLTSGRARSHRIARATLRVGSTQTGSALAGAVFAGNLTQPLTAVFDGAVDFTTDGVSELGPSPFDSRLAFVFGQPLQIAVPTAGAPVFDLTTEGNDNVGDAAHLDAFVDPANFATAGFSEKNGRGCGIDPGTPAGPFLDVTGTFEPGGALHISGLGFPANGSVSVLVTSRVFGSPLAFPNTNPTCWAYVDVGSTLLSLNTTASASGTIRGGDGLPVPKRPAPAGAVIYVQSVTPVAPFSGNTFGLASSNYRTVEIGGAKTPNVAAWTAVHAGDARAPIATTTFFGGLALRFE